MLASGLRRIVGEQRQIPVALLLEVPELRHVVKHDDGQRDGPAVVPHARAHRQDTALLAVPSDAQHLAVHEPFASQGAQERALLDAERVSIEIVDFEQPERIERLQLLPGDAQDGPRGVVEDQDAAARVGDDDALAQILNVVRRLYHFGRSVSELARACRLMGEGAYDRLHADDDDALLDVLALAFEEAGYGVARARDGRQALEAIRSLRPDVVVSDVNMPHVDGFTLCRRLRESGDGLPLVLLTSRDSEIDEALGLEIGADDYVTKPFSTRVLLARVAALLRREELRAGGVPPAKVVRGDLELDIEHSAARTEASPWS